MRKILLFILLFSITAFASAQAKKKHKSRSFAKKKPPYRYEWIASLGASNFLGDLGGADQIGTNGIKDLEVLLTRPAVGASMRMKVMPFVTVKNNLYFGIVRGDDKLTKEFFRMRRNLNFKSPIIEISSQLEFNFVREQKGHIYKIQGVRGMRHKERQLYLFGGPGIAYFNPRGKYNGKWYALRPLRTEGQTKKYLPITPILYGGAGVRFAINRYMAIGFELAIRKTFTDYMDDVSTSYPDPSIFNGNPAGAYLSNPMIASPANGDYCYPCTGEIRGDSKDKDAYMFGTFTFGYKVMYRKRSRSKF